jgi:hypothetical protein
MTGPTERADHRACRVRVYVHEARPALPHLLHAGRTQRSWPERSWRRTSNPRDVSPRGLAGQGRHARLDSAAETRHSSIEVDHPLSLSIRPRPERRAHRTTPGETRRCIPNRGSGVHRPIRLAAPESVFGARARRAERRDRTTAATARLAEAKGAQARGDMTPVQGDVWRTSLLEGRGQAVWGRGRRGVGGVRLRGRRLRRSAWWPLRRRR